MLGSLGHDRGFLCHNRGFLAHVVNEIWCRNRVWGWNRVFGDKFSLVSRQSFPKVGPFLSRQGLQGWCCEREFSIATHRPSLRKRHSAGGAHDKPGHAHETRTSGDAARTTELTERMIRATVG